MDILDEVWLPVIGFEDSCEISNLGNVRTIDRFVGRSDGKKYFSKGRILRGMRNEYLSVRLRDPLSDKRVNRTVHSLVAHAFIGDRPEGYLINHLDGNKYNNSLRRMRLRKRISKYTRSASQSPASSIGA